MEYVAQFNLKQDLEIIFTWTYNECLYKLQRYQGQSTVYALNYWGYKIEETTESYKNNLQNRRELNK